MKACIEGLKARTRSDVLLSLDHMPFHFLRESGMDMADWSCYISDLFTKA